MNLRTVTWRGGPPGRQALLESERPPAFATIPMTRAMLADFDFYTIEFTHRGERTLGFLSHDPERNQFAIVYSVSDQDVEKRMTLLLGEEQIENIAYDPVAEILVLP